MQGRDTVVQVADVLTAHWSNPVASLPYLTAEQKWADNTERNTNCQLTEVVVEGEAGRPWKVTGNFVSGGTVYQRVTDLTPTREAEAPYMYPQGSYVIDGAANTALTKFKVSIKRNVDPVQTTGLNAEDTVPLNYEVDVDYTYKYVNADFYRKARYAAAAGTTVPVDLATTALDLNVARGSYSARLGLPLLHVIDAKANKLDPDGKTTYVDVVAAGIKNATYQIFTVCRTAATAAY